MLPGLYPHDIGTGWQLADVDLLLHGTGHPNLCIDGHLLPGIARVLPPDRIEYLGKSGRAYGFHLDNAYIENLDNGCAVAVTATIYANANEVLNDDAYEYDEVTRPFLRDLGEAVARASLVDCRD